MSSTAETRRLPTTIALLTGTLLSSMDVTVVGTALPRVTGQLGGLELYPWVFSVYLLTATVTGPIWGKLADLFGRKRTYLAGILTFLAGSAALTGSVIALDLGGGVGRIGSGRFGVGTTVSTFLPASAVMPFGSRPVAPEPRLIVMVFSGVLAANQLAGRTSSRTINMTCAAIDMATGRPTASPRRARAIRMSVTDG